MEFARFATFYTVTFAALGAAFSFAVSPFLGVHWAHWLIAGIIQAMVVGTIVMTWLASDPDDAPGVLNPVHGVSVVLLPPVTLFALAIMPLAHWPMVAWLLPGGVLAFMSMGVAYAAIGEEDAGPEEVSHKRVNYSSNTLCEVPRCSELSTHETKFPIERGRSVEVEMCLGHNMEFRVEIKDGTIKTYDDLKYWMNHRAPWSRREKPNKAIGILIAAQARMTRQRSSTAATRGGA